MKILDKSDATAPLADYAADIDKEPVVITSEGTPIAALVSIENADLETISLSTNPQFLELIERSRVRQRTEGGISSQEMLRRLATGES